MRYLVEVNNVQQVLNVQRLFKVVHGSHCSVRMWSMMMYNIFGNVRGIGVTTKAEKQMAWVGPHGPTDTWNSEEEFPEELRIDDGSRSDDDEYFAGSVDHPTARRVKPGHQVPVAIDSTEETGRIAVYQR